ncbi:uncharacterized protein IWZ02DRAFT_148769 [Phyllosticta citriasiana]|uniref:uncharacterized protein n=1 Tax=Phyllosticta citriasiana TaxID=595635 RepID=UPI0030FD7FE8
MTDYGHAHVSEVDVAVGHRLSPLCSRQRLEGDWVAQQHSCAPALAGSGAVGFFHGLAAGEKMFVFSADGMLMVESVAWLGGKWHKEDEMGSLDRNSDVVEFFMRHPPHEIMVVDRQHSTSFPSSRKRAGRLLRTLFANGRSLAQSREVRGGCGNGAFRIRGIRGGEVVGTPVASWFRAPAFRIRHGDGSRRLVDSQRHRNDVGQDSGFAPVESDRVW